MCQQLDPTRTSRDVRFRAALKRIADIERAFEMQFRYSTGLKGSPDWSARKANHNCVHRERPQARPATAGRASIHRKNSDGVLAHLLGDVVGLANGKADNCQRWVLGAARRELATVRDEQIPDVMTLAEFVADAVARIF